MAEETKRKEAQHDDDVAGKAYDGRLMRRLIGYLRPYKWQAVVSLIAVLLKAFFDVIGPYLTKVAVDRYMTTRPDQHLSWFAKKLSSNPMHGISQLAGLYLASLVMSYVLEFVQTYLMQWTGQKVMFDLRRQIFRHLQTMHVGFFDRNPVGRLVTRLTSDVDALNEMFTSGVFSIFEDALVLAGIVFIMIRMSWWLALIAFSVLPFILIVTRIFRKHVRESYRRVRNAIARINSYTQEHVSGMSVVQLFNRQQRSYEAFENVNNQHMIAFKDTILAYALYYPAVELLSSVAIALIIWLGGNGVMRNAVTLGVLVAFMQYALRFFRPIQDMSEKYNILQAAMAACERIFKLIDTEPQVLTPENPRSGDGSARIEFDHVWFTYQKLTPEQETLVAKATKEELAALGTEIEWILKDVSFAIEPGQTAAIVGHTGAGKTTIISLMMRFYDVQRGSVLVNGLDVREHALTQLRQQFGVVLQDPFLFSGTIGENICLGSSWITDKQMLQASEDVNLLDFINTLPGRFDEPVRERGNSLSTGQKQLINFARALAHNPRMLILDEATSSVDTDTEMRVRSALERMVEGRTSVVIAHRLSTVQSASQILVMHKGQLRERGTHQELLSRRGIYWKLYQLQYKDQEIPEAVSTATFREQLATGMD
jgi:ATP-binding cassette, subfamily B, multidrug efflux pump